MKLDPDSPMYLAARFVPKTTCDLHSNLPTGSASKPKCRGCPYWTLARPQSTCSGWDGCFSQQQSSNVVSSFELPPTGFLHTDARVHHTGTRLPQSGCSRRAQQLAVHTLQPDTMQALDSGVKRTTIMFRRVQHLSPIGCN